jgi:hypothetical protein
MDARLIGTDAITESSSYLAGYIALRILRQAIQMYINPIEAPLKTNLDNDFCLYITTSRQLDF